MRLVHLLAPALLIAVTGCVGPPVLERQVLAYDEVTSTLDQKLLLLNIARLSQGNPVHFTETSAIAATFDWTTTIGAGGTIAESSGTNLFDFNFGVSASENPTFSIIPISGNEFSKQILEPFDENDFQFHIFPRGGNIDRILRLLVGGFDIKNPDGSHVRSVENDPRRPGEYETFRRIVMHLHWLNEDRKLFIRPLVFDKVVIDGLEVPPRRQDLGQETGITWKRKPDGKFLVTRFTAGRLAITNFDPLAMTDDERFRLNEVLKRNPKGHVYVDIRADSPGGEVPIRGTLKLRSIFRMLDFVANGIEFAPEFDVAPDPRTTLPTVASAGKLTTVPPPLTVVLLPAKS